MNKRTVAQVFCVASLIGLVADITSRKPLVFSFLRSERQSKFTMAADGERSNREAVTIIAGAAKFLREIDSSLTDELLVISSYQNLLDHADSPQALFADYVAPILKVRPDHYFFYQFSCTALALRHDNPERCREIIDTSLDVLSDESKKWVLAVLMGYVAKTVIKDDALGNAYIAIGGSYASAPDYLKNVSRRIIVGEPIKIGTPDFHEFVRSMPHGKKMVDKFSRERAPKEALTH